MVELEILFLYLLVKYRHVLRAISRAQSEEDAEAEFVRQALEPYAGIVDERKKPNLRLVKKG